MLTVVLPLAPSPLRLNDKRAAVNRVDDRVPAARESPMRPGARIPERIAATGLRVIAREDVKVGDFLDLGAIGVAGDGADVEDAETGLVVGLVGKTVPDELVVVNHAGGGLVVAGDLRGFEVLDVPDIRHGEAVFGWRVGCGAVGVDLALVELVVHDDVGLPVLVGDPALVSVGSSDVRGAGDDGAGADALLVGDIVDGEGILVVAVANVTTVVLLVGATVYNALSIVGVAVLGRAALDVRLGNIIGVDEDGATGAGVVAAWASTAAECNCVVLLLVRTDSVRAALDTLLNVYPRNVGLDVKGLGALWGELEKLLQIEKLDTMTNALRSDNEGVLEDLHFTPDYRVILGGEAAKVLELAIFGDLGEGCTISLADRNEFAALVAPAP